MDQHFFEQENGLLPQILSEGSGEPEGNLQRPFQFTGWWMDAREGQRVWLYVPVSQP